MIHEQLIRYGSKFFDNAMKGVWQESHLRIITMPDDTPETVTMYQHWLYTGVLLAQHVDDKDEKKSHEATGIQTIASEEMSRLEAYYRFGNKVDDSDSRDAVVDGIRRVE